MLFLMSRQIESNAILHEVIHPFSPNVASTVTFDTVLESRKLGTDTQSPNNHVRTRTDEPAAASRQGYLALSEASARHRTLHNLSTINSVIDKSKRGKEIPALLYPVGVGINEACLSVSFGRDRSLLLYVRIDRVGYTRIGADKIKNDAMPCQ
ncbi:hypothetical protein DL98DRAFT_268116 [Cadophora sp. DSE1049]|nr:hypothetical protein DL98DRAFT_268116 [Cadophora sp. DSE1049]